MSKPVLLLLLLWPLPAFGQSIVTVSPQQCVWRAGDDPAWAAPNLDETGWRPSAHWKIPLEEPHLWARCHADFGALRGTAHPAIQISLIGAYQLFVDGVLVGGAGNVRTGFYSMNTMRQYPLTAAVLKAQPVTIALRITLRDQIATTSPLEIHAGDMEALAGRRAGNILAHKATLPLAMAVFFGVVGLMLLGLFYYDRSRRELLYLSILCVQGAVGWAEVFSSAILMNYPVALHDALLFAGDIVAPVVLVLFYFALARRRVPRLYWLPMAVVVAQFSLQGFELLLPPNAALRLWRLDLAVNDHTLLYSSRSWRFRPRLLSPSGHTGKSLAACARWRSYACCTARPTSPGMSCKPPHLYC